MHTLNRVRTVITAATAALAIAATGLASAQGATASVYFENDLDAVTTPVNVYVNGELIYQSVFLGDVSAFPASLPVGVNSVVVTPFYLQPGEQDLVSTTVDVGSGGVFTLSLDEVADDLGFVNGYGLSLTSGVPHTDVAE